MNFGLKMSKRFLNANAGVCSGTVRMRRRMSFSKSASTAKEAERVRIDSIAIR
jgi:hypothetical protein